MFNIPKFSFLSILKKQLNQNMDNIVEPNESFDFTKLSLGQPTSIQGGSYFTKVQYNAHPLYIQTTKSLTRQGFVKSGKKYYCDLMFDKNSENLITWFETLEETCQKLIHAKSDSWFQNPLELSDIESAFNSTIRIYKSGKFYLVRVNVKNNAAGEPSLKIYNEDENTLSIHDVTAETEMLCILEIQGIKFTSKNFQIEIEIKQAMVIHDEPIFESCLIKTNKKSKPMVPAEDEIKLAESATLGKIMLETNKPSETKNAQQTQSATKSENINLLLDENEKTTTDATEKHVHKTEDEKETKSGEEDNEKNGNDSDSSEDENDNEADEEDEFDFDDEDVEYKESLVIDENNNVDNDELGILDLDEKPEEDENQKDDLKEVNIENLEESTEETVKLRKPNEVYFEMYKEAREKAKKAKKAAILAYLEAKNIKKTYMLDNLTEDSDNEFDAEIEEVTEAELDGL